MSQAAKSKTAEWSRRYRQRHPGRAAATYRKWYHGHLGEARKSNRDRSRSRYKKDRDKILARNRLWRAANKEKIRNRDMRRRARFLKASLENPRLISKWMIEVRALRVVRCYWCGTKLPGRKAHFDHVVSIALGGAHSISNLCVSCPECNLSKKDTPIVKWSKHPQIFLSL